MKNKPLKHYKRKKFFYRFFMRKSPRSGAMFGLAWMNMVIALIPFFVFCIFQIVGRCDSWGGFVLSGGIIVSQFLLYLYGILCSIFSLEKIFRKTYKIKKVSSVLSGISAWFAPTFGVFLLPVLLYHKRWIAALFAFVGIAYYGVNFYYLNIGFTVLFWGSLFYLIGLAFVPEQNKFSWKFMIPLGIAVALHLFLFGYDVKLQMDIKQKRTELSSLIGRSLEIEDFWQHDAKGFSSDKDPLKTLIEKNPESIGFEYFTQYNQQTAKKKLLELQQQHPDFILALEKFLTLPAHYFAHKKSEDGLLNGTLLTELSVFRNASNILSLKIAADPENKQNLQRYNSQLQKLRTWSLQNHFLLSYLVAVSIERNRLNALRSVIIRSKLYSKSEIQRLIGNNIEWNKFLRFALGDEAIAFYDSWIYLQNKVIPAELSAASEPLMRLKRHVPLFVHVHFLRDYRFALDNYIDLCSVSDDLPALEQCRLTEADSQIYKRNFFICSGMLLPSINAVFKHTARTVDVRQMALLAAEVMEYRKRHGKLPEDLSFLPQIPLAKLDHKPLMYEQTREGFRIFSHTDKGEKPDEKDIAYSYRVFLPEQAELPLEKLITIAEKELVKVYGKRVLKQRPWKITRSDEKSITLTGTFHGQGKGGVAEITLQKSNGKVLRMIHGK